MTVKDIVKRFLKANRYDGLFNTNGDCGCEIDDLMPCDDHVIDCEPGYKRPCPGDCGDHGFHIEATKR